MVLWIKFRQFLWWDVPRNYLNLSYRCPTAYWGIRTPPVLSAVGLILQFLRRQLRLFIDSKAQVRLFFIIIWLWTIQYRHWIMHIWGEMWTTRQRWLCYRLQRNYAQDISWCPYRIDTARLKHKWKYTLRFWRHLI